MKVNKRLKILILIAVIALIIVIITMSVISQNKKTSLTVDEFSTVKDVAEYMKSKYIKQGKSKSEIFDIDIYVEFKYDLFTDNESNEYFYKLFQDLVAKTLDYQNFRIIDDSKELVVAVICDKERKFIKERYYNGELNYFKETSSEKTISEYIEKKDISFNVQSNIIKGLIDNNWNYKKSNFGTKNSGTNDQEIYSNEGIEVRKIGTRIQNLRLTKNYKENIVNNIKIGESFENIKKVLGKPLFEELGSSIGYKNKDFYMFFYKDEVSIYKTDDGKNNEKFGELFSKYNEDRRC